MIGGCGQNANTSGTTQAAAETTSAQENGASQETGAAEDEHSQAELSSGEEMTGPTVEAGPDIAVANTQSGKVQGYISNGIYTYHGIPYAQADERFVEAHEVEPWEGVRMAFDYGPISPQEATGNIPGGDNMDNNCQNLNIWTPGIQDEGKRPVMVWLHGGGFSTGSSIEQTYYDGENLSKKGDVVVVSVNHRLNVLGHLNLSQYGDQYKNSANVGMTDIIDALQWIQDSIEEFGGDPDNVTVFGESGGGAKVLALMTSPYAKGLFHKGIVESGATETMGVIFTPEDASERVTELTLEKLGITPDRIDELQNVSYEELTAASNEALAQAGEEFQIPAALGSGYSLSWEPVVDGDFLPTDPVTEDSFAEAGRDIPLLIGSNLNEWETVDLMSNQAETQYDNKTTWTEEETRQHLEEKYGDQTDEIVDAFLKAYPHRTAADALYVDSRVIRLPILKIMSHKADQGGAPVYAYMFNWESPVLPGTIMAFHTSEIPFVFNNIDKAVMQIGGGEEARRIEDAMSQAWINFARTGDPSTEEMEWPAYTREEGATMMFDTVQEVVYHHDQELMALLAPNYEY
ncbi:MAG: carboxylesterase/lipase family protein [Lachnospiraceae bacterium]|nr:carboxylesterase/lipase family protein [Lachnospiraceae bacterium]